MTEEQKEMAIVMLESGCTYEQVSRNIGVPASEIAEVFQKEYETGRAYRK
ncbi:MAG: hypothetical protein IKZ01_01265 [Anaerotignum sp.]|nr:hypothetical protein [Anaerotignum sp.]MBR5121935.1 hypothetical protein [Anaerotignum sp.]